MSGISSQKGPKLRDLVVRQADTSCYSWAALSLNDSKTRHVGPECTYLILAPVFLDVPDGVDLVDELVGADLVLVEAPVGVGLHRELERLPRRCVDEPDLRVKVKCL